MTFLYDECNPKKTYLGPSVRPSACQTQSSFLSSPHCKLCQSFTKWSVRIKHGPLFGYLRSDVFYFSSRASIKSSHIKNWRRRRNERIAKKTDLISKTKTLNLQHAFWCIYLPSPHHKRCQISSEWQCHRSLNFISAIIVSSTLQRPSPLRFRRKHPAVESVKY